MLKSQAKVLKIYRKLEIIDKWQATKGARRMPWYWEAMKDVAICENPRWADKQASTRGCPNGETHFLTEVSSAESIGREKQTQGTETSKYLEEEKLKKIP